MTRIINVTRQDKQLKSSNEKTVVLLDNIILPGFVSDLLAFGRKHSIRDKCKELYFLAEIEFDKESA